MREKLISACLIIVMTLIIAACGAAPANDAAKTSSEPVITITEPFARASMPNGAAYMTIVNEGGSDDTLLSAESDVAESVELHETTIGENDVMQMSPVENILVPAGGSALLEPGGKHVMLMGLQEGVVVGDTFTLTLNFQKSGAQTVQVEVTEGMTMDHDMDSMEQGDMEHAMDGEMNSEMEDGTMEHKE
ncbi:MAG: copper chaperone PCu(A)C [Anaerolineae bacterium]|nr:copper chaperone PCu(A)C [Anaerolineae bacterium]